MDALMSIEGFRNLNSDLETIINKSDAVKGMRKGKDDLTPKEKKDLSQEEKEIKSLRKADTAETDQICRQNPHLHVSVRLPGILPERCDHPTGAASVPESNRADGKKILNCSSA